MNFGRLFGAGSKGRKGSAGSSQKWAQSRRSIDPDDLEDLRTWAAGKAFVEAYVEPETLVNELSVVIVDEHGQSIRRRLGGPRGIDAVAETLGCPVYDVEETGYPDRLRKAREREHILRKREEQRQRREAFERHNRRSGDDNATPDRG